MRKRLREFRRRMRIATSDLLHLDKQGHTLTREHLIVA
jgi:hypothetical protein